MKKYKVQIIGANVRLHWSEGNLKGSTKFKDIHSLVLHINSRKIKVENSEVIPMFYSKMIAA
jgi:hypothetical protein